MNKLKFFIIPVLILILFTTPSCDQQDETIPEDLYITLFTELSLLNRVNEEIYTDSEREALRKEIFEHYDVTEEEFRISHNLYESRVEEQIARMDSINRRLRDVRDEIDLAQREYREIQDSLRQVQTGDINQEEFDSEVVEEDEGAEDDGDDVNR